MIRVLAVALLAVLLYVLMQVPVTMPALCLIGLVAWAVAASVLAVVIHLRTHHSIDRKGP